MDLQETPAQVALRKDIRQWIATSVPADLQGRDELAVSLSHEQLKPLRNALGKQGWILPYLPKEYGGGGLDPIQTITFMEEMANAGVPYLEARGGGISNICAILAKWATPELKEKLLKPSLRGEITWCQGYSEPESGSDLATLQTKAEVTPEGFTINGGKIWTSQAHRADWIFLLARTDPTAKRKQDGISFFVFDMKTPGITIRPLITLDGNHHFNQTFYENVKIPKTALVGDLNKGWSVAKALLVHERLNSPGASTNMLGRVVNGLKTLAREVSDGKGGVMWEDQGLRREVAEFEMQVDAIRSTRYRVMTAMAKGQEPGNETMMLKFNGSELLKRMAARSLHTGGSAGVTWRDPLLGEALMYLAWFVATVQKNTIAAGTAEVQRNVIAKRVLGLPN